MEHRIAPRTASEWLLALREAPADRALRARFEYWIDAAPEHARDWDEIARTDALLGRTQPRFREHWAGRQRLAAVPARRARRAALAAAAAAIVLAIALAWLPDTFDDLRADHVTATAELRRIELADGSVLDLAPRTAVRIDLDPAARRVTLLHGIVHLDVAPDPRRPFTVAAGPMGVSVVGTRFEVRLVGGEASVAVAEGTVELIPSQPGEMAGERVHAGGWRRIDTDGHIRRGQTSTGGIAAWRDGRLLANDRRVGDVVDELRRYYPGIILLADGALARQPLTGVFRLADPLAALHAVAASQHAAVHRPVPGLVILSSGD
jgi:transmembrane sensor